MGQRTKASAVVMVRRTTTTSLGHTNVGGGALRCVLAINWNVVNFQGFQNLRMQSVLAFTCSRCICASASANPSNAISVNCNIKNCAK